MREHEGMSETGELTKAIDTACLDWKRVPNPHLPEISVTNDHGHVYAVRVTKDGQFVVAYRSKESVVHMCGTVAEVVAEIQREKPRVPAVPPA
jgi:hypothetical protein